VENPDEGLETLFKTRNVKVPKAIWLIKGCPHLHEKGFRRR